jgi:hypothetical protein
MSDGIVIAAISTAVGIFGTGGIVAYFKFRNQKGSGQFVVDAAKGAVIVHTGVLKDISDQYERQGEEIQQLRMELATIEEQHNKCQVSLLDVQLSVRYMRRDLDRHGRASEICRRKCHVAVNVVQGFELLIENIFDEMRKHNVPITDDLRPTNMKRAYREEMNKLDELEASLLERMLTESSPPSDDSSHRVIKDDGEKTV